MKSHITITINAHELEESRKFGLKNLSGFVEQSLKAFLIQSRARAYEVAELIPFKSVVCSCGTSYSSKFTRCPSCGTSISFSQMEKTRL